jgi:hypothetical protein
MRTITRIAFLSGLAMLFAAPASTLAQGPRRHGSQGWGPGSGYGRLYDPAKVEKVGGQVLDVRKVTPMRGMSYGVEIVVKTSTDKVAVHLGPAWFVENQDIRIAKGDTVEVEGSRVTFEGKPVVLAASVRKGDDVLQLRDAAGVPVWAGWRRTR